MMIETGENMAQTTASDDWMTATADWFTTGGELEIPPLGLWNPALDVPAIVILTFVLLLGNLNVLTLIVYAATDALKEKPLNFLVVAMAVVDLILCNVGGALDLAQVVTSLSGQSKVWCASKLCIQGFCHYASLTLMAFIGVYRLYLVVRRHMQGRISTNAAWTAIVVSVIVGALRVIGRLRGFTENVNMIRCVGFAPPLPDDFDVQSTLCVLALVTAFSATIVQFLSFTLNIPSGSDSNVVEVGGGTVTVVDLNLIATGPATFLCQLALLLSFLLPGLPYQVGYRPLFTDTLNQHALMRSLLYLHAAVKPLIYFACVPVYRCSLFTAFSFKSTTPAPDLEVIPMPERQNEYSAPEPQ